MGDRRRPQRLATCEAFWRRIPVQYVKWVDMARLRMARLDEAGEQIRREEFLALLASRFLQLTLTSFSIYTLQSSTSTLKPFGFSHADCLESHCRKTGSFVPAFLPRHVPSPRFVYRLAASRNLRPDGNRPSLRRAHTFEKTSAVTAEREKQSTPLKISSLT